MNPEQARETVFTVLRQITPEADFQELEPDVEFREQLDIDSMDFLNFLVAVHQRTGVEIPEADYGKLATLDQLVAYLARKTGTT